MPQSLLDWCYLAVVIDDLRVGPSRLVLGRRDVHGCLGPRLLFESSGRLVRIAFGASACVPVCLACGFFLGHGNVRTKS